MSSELAKFEGLVPPMVMDGEREPCASCGDPLTREAEITFYWCDRDYVNGNGGSSIYRLYCTDCDRHKIQFPAQGVVELLARAWYTDEGVITDVEKEHLSPADDGTPWEPDAMFKLFVGEPIESALSGMDGVVGGPEDVYDTLRRGGIDPREIVNDDGKLIVTRSEIRSLREQFTEQAVAQGH